MNEQKNNGRGIFYGVIGVATLVVAIIGATFAYFTATASNNTVITGNMATITFDLAVTKVTTVDEVKQGMIPMSNNMVEAAVSNADDANGDGPCTDDNGNAVCQIYRIDVTNTGSAVLLLDGYVSLTGGSGAAPTDVVAGESSEWKNVAAGSETTMRWAQVFQKGDVYTTAGKTTTGAQGANGTAGTVTGIDTDWTALGNTAAGSGHDVDKIIKSSDFASIAATGAVETGYINNFAYDIINKNYIRISDHNPTSTYDRLGDITSALVYNQLLTAASDDATTDGASLYIVVWLSETGTNQTAGATTGQDSDGADIKNPAALEFFSGNVTFNSAQGSEVSATFNGYARVARTD